MQNNYILGLDIGVTSVGWGIIDKQDNVIGKGVRLFEEADASNNEKRREKRGARRVKRRRQQRITEMRRLLVKEGLIDSTDFRPLDKPYEIRVKGLDHELSDKELATALLHIVKRRGSTLDIADFDEDDKEDMKAKANLAANTRELKENKKYICEIQLDRLRKDRSLRGHANIFKTEDYAAEAKAILKAQDKSSAFIEKAIELITRKRHYSDGPGSATSPTPYGRYRIDEKTGEIIKVNLIEEMRGRCSVYPEELRAPLMAFSAELFNFLNDLNNLKIAGEQPKLTTEQKKKTIDTILDKGYLKPKNDQPNGLATLLGLLPETISGFRVDSKGKPIMTEFKGYQKFLKAFKDAEENISTHLDKLDRIAEILSSHKLYDERYEAFNEMELSDKLKESLAKLSGFEKYHSFSLKAIREINEEMKVTDKNQMQIITDNALTHLEKPRRLKIDDAAILSPVAKRAHKEALGIVEALQKKYGYFDKIVIETTRAKNNKEERDNIRKAQDKNRMRKQDAAKLVVDKFGESQAESLSGTQLLKLRLYKEQNGKCAYTYNPLDIRPIVERTDAYEIDHIIPYSISLDNSYNNKVLVENSANQKKGNRTPFAYFKSGKAYGVITDYESFKKEVLSNKNYSRHKKTNLLNEEDITKFDALEEFTARNLVDTSYAVRSLMGSMKQYYKAHELPTKIFTVRGKVTNLFRGLGIRELYKDNPGLDENPLEKNRDQYHHHAIDALIAARLSEQKLIRNLLWMDRTKEIDEETGEVIFNNSPIEDGRLIRFVKSLAEFGPEDFRYSWKVDKKPNRSFSDETIYSTRTINDEEMVIKKEKDIYSLTSDNIARFFTEGKKRRELLAYHHDRETYDRLKAIYEQYNHEKYPYAAYKEEHGDIRKYAKKDNGPAIKQLKYIDSRLGSHLDISHNYNPNDKKIVLQQISPYRTDFYQNPDGAIKFVTIKYADMKKEGDEFLIDSDLYQKKLKDKKIMPEARFIGSFNRNEIIRITNKEKDGLRSESWRFIATNSDKQNKVEVKSIAEKDQKIQIMKTIGKKTVLVEKFSASPLGEISKVENNVLKLRV